MKTFLMLSILGALVLLTIRADSQGADGARVVATCGTAIGNYTPGSMRPLTINTNGQVCQ